MSAFMSREQMAELLGISRAFLGDLLQYEDAPQPVAKQGKGFTYRAEAALAWIASDPVGRHRALTKRKRAATFEDKRQQPSRAMDLALARRFLTGKAVNVNTGQGF